MTDRGETGNSGRKKKPEGRFCAEKVRKCPEGKRTMRNRKKLKKKNRGTRIIEAVETIRQ